MYALRHLSGPNATGQRVAGSSGGSSSPTASRSSCCCSASSNGGSGNTSSSANMLHRGVARSFRIAARERKSPVVARCAGGSSTVVETAAATAPSADAKAAADGLVAQRKRVLSGVQPTGKLHLGNYMGAIKNWVGLQETYDTFFCVVDLHAITVPHDPKELRDSTRTMAATYLAAGIDPDRATVFVQSHVTAHAELQWLLNCVTPIGWLNRMIQFKEKSRKQGEEVRAGLLTYPVLMAADILLYQADLVPVGEDQKQHLELTRDIAERVNGLYGGKGWKKRGGRGGRVFKVPEVFIPPAGARVMSLQDGTAKMSKSAENDLSRINLTDTAKDIQNKVKRCKTDAFEGLEFGNEERPECTNLLTLYQLASGQTKEAVAAEVAAMRWGDFKPKLADALVAHLEPIQTKYADLMSDPAYIDSVLTRGADAANETAARTLADCKDAMGFVLPRRG
uniref:tryptophan--tRNA ligase n=1 Tax=Chlamydomonas euryale TaxID=1486919 RepID=A0A7R9V1U2_9CHLO